MFCRSCGQELAPEAELCTSCGVRPPRGNLFCSNCGNSVVVNSDTCVNCGAIITNDNGKSKVASILLAIFLGFWTWLYTYKRNFWKFWIALGVWILYLIISTVGYYRHTNIPTPVELLMLLAIFGLWIWSIIDASTKNKDWYLFYNYGRVPIATISKESTSKKRNGWLTTWLILLLVGSILGIFLSISNGSNQVRTISILQAILGLTCTAALFNWRKWGFWGWCVLAVIMFFINIFINHSGIIALGGLVSPLITYGILHIGKENKGWPQLF